jgi:hypothetical protein
VAKKDDGWALPFPPGAVIAAGLGLLAFSFLKGGNQAPAQAPQGRGPQPPWPPQGTAVPQQLASQPFMSGGIMGMDNNGIPIVPLPGRSAQHTASVRGSRPSIPGIIPQGRADQQMPGGGGPASPESYRNESFGGSGMGGGSLGGESF